MKKLFICIENIDFEKKILSLFVKKIKNLSFMLYEILNVIYKYYTRATKVSFGN